MATGPIKQSPKRGLLAFRLAAFALLAPAFGGGMFFGRSCLGPRPPADAQPAEPAADAGDEDMLAQCQQALRALPRIRSSPLASAEALPDADASALTPKARVDALQAQIKTCRKSEVLVNAEICASVGRHYAAILALPDNGVLCIQRARAASFIEEDYEKCDDFAELPNDLDLDSLTKEERSTLLEAVKVRKTIGEDELRKQMGHVYETCFATAEKNKHL